MRKDITLDLKANVKTRWRMLHLLTNISIVFFILAAVLLLYPEAVTAVSLNVTSTENFYNIQIMELSGSLNDYELWVSYTDEIGTVQESKYFGTLQDNIRFSPYGDGIYTFTLRNVATGDSVCAESIVKRSIKNFNLEPSGEKDLKEEVLNLNNASGNESSGRTACNIFKIKNETIELGESIDIIIESSTMNTIQITHDSASGTQTFMLRKDVEDFTPSFIPPESGDYTITAICSISASQSKIIHVNRKIHSDTELRMVSVIDSKGLELVGSIQLHDIKRDNITRVNRIALPVSNVARSIGLENVGESIDRIMAVTSEEDVATDASVSLDGLEGFYSSNIKLKDLVVSDSGNPIIKIEKVPEYEINIPGENAILSYAMDLSTLEFSNGTFTKVAQGRQLWKCREWDYNSRTCSGEWIKIKDIRPGESYTLEISPEDPGYVETGVSTINTEKSLYYPQEIVKIMVAVLDRQGYLADANILVNIIGPEGSSWIYDYDNETIMRESKGIYSLFFDKTAMEGEYSMDVMAYGKNVNSTMHSTFYVEAYHEFDILRNAPLSIDPFKGPFTSLISITPNNIDVTDYEFVEVLPGDVTIINADGGSVIYNSSNNVYTISWNLSGNSVVSYTVQAPLRTPDILILGKSFINYRLDNEDLRFIERRLWYIAVDPDVPTDDGIFIYSDRLPDGGIKYRNWTDNLLGAETYSGVDVGGRRAWVKTRCMKEDTLCLSALSDVDSDLNFAVFYTNNWSFSAIPNIATDLAYTQKSFDLECEGIGRTCILAYETSQAAGNSLFAYRIWNGTALTGPYTYTVPGGDNNEFHWIQLYPKRNSNNIGIVLQTDGGGTGGYPDIYAGIWNGTNFTNWRTLTTYSSSSGDGYTYHKHFDCAWDSSDRLMCIYGNNSYGGILAYRFNGTNWTYLGDIYPGLQAEPWELSICGVEPWSNFTHNYMGIMACGYNATAPNNRLDGGIWDGTAMSKNLATEEPYRNNAPECGTNKGNTGYAPQNFRCRVEQDGSQVLFAWVNNGNDYVRYGTYTVDTETYSFSNWSLGNQIVTDGANDIRAVDLVTNPYTNRIMLLYSDVARDAGCSVWTGTSWDGTGCNNAVAFETAGATAGLSWISFDWFRYQLQPYISMIRPVLSTSFKDYFGITNPSATAAAYNGTHTTLPPNAANSPITGTQFNNACYFATTSSDDNDCYTFTSGVINVYGYQSFKFYITDSPIGIESFKLNYEGRMTRTTSYTSTDIRMYIYNWTLDTYQLLRVVYSGGGADAYVEININGNPFDYVRNRTMYILAESALTSGGTAGTARVDVYTDYISLEVNSYATWRGNQLVNASAIDKHNVSFCEWRYYNSSGSVNAFSGMNNSGIYYYNISDTTTVSDGVYSVYAFCNDTLNNRRNASSLVRIDNNAPVITLYNPSNNTNSTVNYMLFAWNVTDLLNENMLCNITIDGVKRTPYNVVSLHAANTTQNITSIVDGTHYWNVTCIDDAGNTGYSETRTFDSDTAGPAITQNYPAAGAFVNVNPLDLNFTSTDAHQIVNCSIYIDNIINGTLYNLTSAMLTNFTVENLTQGLHRWNVTCYDLFNYRTNSQTRNFTVDYTLPTIYLNTTNGIVFNNTVPQLNYTVIDNIDLSMRCNITVNSIDIDTNIISPNNTLINRNINLLDGFKQWYVTCIDDAGNVNVSESRIFQVYGPPDIQLITPLNNTFGNGYNITFKYYTIDSDGVDDCMFYIDDILNQTNSTPLSPGNNTFFIDDLLEGVHNWSVACNDSSGMLARSEIYIITSDRSPPNIILNSPSPGQVLTVTPTIFTLTLDDALSVNATCNLSVDGTVNVANRNFVASNDSITTRTQTVPNGIHYWNVTCIDLGGNYNFSATQNFTVNVTFPLTVTLTADKILYQQNEQALINILVRNETNGNVATNITLDYIYTNTTFTDIPWWNTSWTTRKPILINETRNLARVGVPIALALNFSIGEIISCQNNLRIIDDLTLSPVPFNVVSGDDTTYCNIIFSGSVTANAVNQNNYHIYYGIVGSDPGYSSVLNLFSDTFSTGAAPDTTYWTYGTGWDILSNLPLTGSHAHIDGNPVVTNTAIRLANYLNLSTYDSINVTFIWDINVNWDTGPPRDYIVVEMTNNSGTSWTPIGELNISNATAYTYMFTLSSAYKINGFNIRFRASVNADNEEGGFDDFAISTTTQSNISTAVGREQLWLERIFNVTNSSGIYNTTYNTSEKIEGNYSAVALAYPASLRNRQGWGYDWFNIIADIFGPSVTLVFPTNGLTNYSGIYNLVYNTTDLGNEISNCSLYINGILNQTNNSAIIERALNNFTVDFDEGVYNWSVRCYDTLNNLGSSSTYNLYLDDTPPTVIALSPDGTTVATGTVQFAYNVTDNIDTSIYCNVTVDDGNYSIVRAASTNGINTVNIQNITEGSHYWNVTCYDNINNTGNSSILYFNAASIPVVRLDYPPTGTGYNMTSMTFGYNISSGLLSNCSLILNGQYNQTVNASDIPYNASNGVNNFTLTNMNYGRYNWTVICFDRNEFNGTEPIRYFQLDSAAPNITMIYPENNINYSTKNVNFRYEVYDIDNMLLCNLTIDGVLNATNIPSNSGSNTTYPVNNMNLTNHNWSVACIDDTGFITISPTWNFTLSSIVTVMLVSPPNASSDGDGNINFSYTPQSAADFTAGICSMYIDNILTANHVALTSGVTDTFPISGINDGYHSWYVNCTDNSMKTGVSATWNFTVDKDGPNVTIYYPDNILFNTSTIYFNWTANDTFDMMLSCNVTVNGTIKIPANVNSPNGNVTNTTYSGITDGLSYWNVTCLDNSGHTGTSNTLNFTIQEPPRISLGNPSNITRTNNRNVTFYYIPYDNSGNISSCTLILDEQLNETNTTLVASGIQRNFTLYDLVPGWHNWTVNCTDPSGNEGTNATLRYMYIDLEGPSIALLAPPNPSFINYNTIWFNWTATDHPGTNINCSIYMDDISNKSITQLSDTMFYTNVSDFPSGPHTWYVNCSDNLNNTNISEAWSFIVSAADLYINDSRITFNNTNPNENNTINISVNVTNFGGINANNVLVEFWDGVPGGGGIFIGNQTGNVTFNNGSRRFSTLWNITLGFHDIYVLVDPYNNIIEADDTNNNATKNISLLRSIITDPLNDTGFAYQNVSFTFNLQDYTGGLINYSVFVDNVFNGQNGTVTDGVPYVINITLVQGIRGIKIEALDALGRRKNSTTVFVTVDYTPPNATINTTNNTWYNYSNPLISIRATDNVDTNINYTIYANDIFNTLGNISNGSTISINLATLTEGYYQLIMEAYDNFNNTANSTPKYIYIDMTSPNISLNSPLDGANYTIRTAVLNYTPRDNLAFTLACNVTLDGNIVASQNIGNGNSSTYTANNLGEGTHYWNVTCRDQALNANISETYSFNVYIKPLVNLISPLNNNWSNSATNTFLFNVSDETGIDNCFILLDGIINQTKDNTQIINNATNNFTIADMTSGNYTWAVECYDNTTYHAYNLTTNRTFYVDLLAPQPYIETVNQSWFNTGSPSIRFNVTDNMDNLLDYTFYVNNTPNVVGTVSNSSSIAVNLVNLQNGTFVVILEAVDNAGNRQNSTSITIYVDSVKPSINLTAPLNNTNIIVNTIDLNFTSSDNMASTLNCNLTLDSNIIASNMTINSGQNQNVTVSGLLGGYHYWNATCVDQALNRNTSLTYVFYVVMPDLYINVSDIFFSNSAPVENETINITATIQNIGFASAQNFTVEIRINSATGAIIHSANISLAINASTNITANYTLAIGDTLFYVLVDTPLSTNGTIRESNESNNNASKSVHVGLWEYVAGTTADRLVMSDFTNQTIFDWLVSNASGSKLFAADIDSNINWKNLQALGINISNLSSSADFYNLDVKLGSTNFSDSVNKTYTVSGPPIELTNYTIYTKRINNVPIVNSTNNSNFKTGILWDYGDGGVRYTGTQDVLFVSPINKNTQGYNATVDYELRIPATLRSYKVGQDLVVFYAEIN